MEGSVSGLALKQLTAARDMCARGSLTLGTKDETDGSRHGREAAGLPSVSGASRTRTGDLLGAIFALF